MDRRTRVIIVNFNAGDALVRSVASVLATREPLHTLVMDNASTDGSCEKLRSLSSGNQRLDILENAQNLGFSRAVNACAQNASEPYLLILNPDCELYPDTMELLLSALQQEPKAALAAPRVVDRQEQVLSGTVRAFPDPWKALVTASGLWRLGRWLPVFRGVERGQDVNHENTRFAEAVSGACMLVRSEVFRQLGGLDEDFAMHFEDLDFMYRLRQNGYGCVYVPAARVFHQPGTSSRSRPWWVHRQKHLGMLRFYRKHLVEQYSPWINLVMRAGVWIHYVATLPGVLLRR